MIPKRNRWIVLLISSITFYFFAGWQALITMTAVSLFSYSIGILIESLPTGSKPRKITLLIGISVIVGWLGIIKLASATGWKLRILTIPLGASYVSFSVISYLVDIYWERDKADKNILKHLLYVLFFPKISQGPITRHNVTSPRIFGGGEMTYLNLTFGLQRMLYGYFKKLVLANRLSMITAEIFSDLSNFSGSIISLATILAALELYFDFSGYMDIILGFSQTLGLDLDENFNHPLLSKSAAEFWRRWHITLGVWFKDYIYTPIVMSPTIKKLGKWAKNKFGKKIGNNIMKIIALSAVWLLTGLWHGATINYIMWGLMWGIIIILSTICEDKKQLLTKKLHINTDAPSWALFQRLFTFIIFCFGILLTRVRSLYDIKTVIDQIFYSFNVSDVLLGKLYQFGVSKSDFNLLIVFIIGTLFVSLIQEKQNIRLWISKLNSPIRWIIYATAISVILFFGIYGVGYSTSGFAYTFF